VPPDPALKAADTIVKELKFDLRDREGRGERPCCRLHSVGAGVAIKRIFSQSLNIDARERIRSPFVAVVLDHAQPRVTVQF